MSKHLWIAIAMAAVLAPAATSHAKRRPPPPATTTAWKFDAAGWTLLGSQSVSGKRDTDTIMVGKSEGKFDQLTLVVEDSDVELKNLVVVFGNGEKVSPSTKHVFREGQRSRVIDLPGANRTISKITLSYANIPGGGAARVSVYGRDTKANNTPGAGAPAMPRPSGFDATGWTMLGAQTVDGRRDRDTIRVRGKAKFDQLTMVVTDSDLELRNLTLVFGNGQKWTPPKLAHVFKEGSRTRVIDLPGKDRFLSRIELSYANLAGGGKAKVELYGRDLGRPAPPPIVRVPWENKGWTSLGRVTADGWRDRDRLNVRNKGPFTELMFVVAGSDIELNGIAVTFGNKETFNMQGSTKFIEGQRTKPVDLPGAARRITAVDFVYANLPGGGRATVEVWARLKPGAAPTPLPGSVKVRDHRAN